MSLRSASPPPVSQPRHEVGGQVASSELAREINRDVLLARIRALQPISRVDLARSSGLQPSTVSSIVEQLLSEGWIREGAAQKTARGRRPTLLSLNDDVVILVADIQPSTAVVGLVDLNGRFLERQVVALGSDARPVVHEIARVMLEFRARHLVNKLEGVGVSLPGRVDHASGKLLLSPHLRWGDIDLQAELRGVLHLQVHMENAANASLLGELWFGRRRGLRNAAFITVAEGMSTAILADERLVTGHSGLAGEFGHLCLDPTGPVCSCGSRGCWEVFASDSAALRYFEAASPHPDKKNLLEVVSLAIDRDPAAVAALEMQSRAIGKGLHLLNAVLSPDLILVARDLAIPGAQHLEIIRQECSAGMMAGDCPEIVLVDDGDMARLRGAAAVALQRHPGYYRASRTR